MSTLGAPAERRRLFNDKAVLFGCGLLLAIYVRLLALRWGLYQPLPDFSIFWTAGRLALAGKAAVVYDPLAFNALMDAEFGKTLLDFVRTFFYPPMFLLILAPLGMLPFWAAAALWLGGSTAIYLAGIRAILPGAAAMLAALAAPVVLFNFNWGQNGLLTAGLLAGALALLDSRPTVSGVLFGLLVYKPQFGVLLPLFLAVTGRWRVFAAAAATVAALALVTAAIFGPQIFAVFAGIMPSAAEGYLRQAPNTPGLHWSDLESIYGMLRALGVGDGAAWAVHLAVALAAAAAMLRLATAEIPYAVQAAALATAIIVAAPYSESNDMAVLMVAWAFLLRDGAARGFRRWERPALWTVYLLPLAYLLGRVVVTALGLVDLAAWSGMGPLMCGLLAAVIASRLALQPAPRTVVAPLPRALRWGR